MNIRPNNLNTSVIYNINSASHRNLNAVLGSITLDIVLKTKQQEDLIVRQKCLILREDLNLEIVLLGEDFLMSNNVSIKYDDQTRYIVVHVNDSQVSLLNDQTEENLQIYNSSTFLTESMVTKKVLQSSTVLPKETRSPKPADNFDPVM